MQLPRRPVDATLHGVTDYTMGTLLLTALPRLVGVAGTPAARQIRIAGAVHVGYSTLTDYPLGVVRLVPFKVHLALDALGALALGATPFVTGQAQRGGRLRRLARRDRGAARGRRAWVPHVALAAFELASLAMTDPTGRGDFHGDVEAVRRANELDPGAAVRGAPAVRPAAPAATA